VTQPKAPAPLHPLGALLFAALAVPGGAVPLDAWPKSTREVVEALGARAAQRAR